MYDFLIINDVRQILDPKIFGGGPWVHLATITTPPKNIRGKVYSAREYICFKHKNSRDTYIEEVDLTSPGMFKKIVDESLWRELAEFLTNKGLLAFSTAKEVKIAKPQK